MEGTYPSLREFKDSQEETDLLLRNMDANMLQGLNDDCEKNLSEIQRIGRITGTSITSYPEVRSKNARK